MGQCEKYLPIFEHARSFQKFCSLILMYAQLKNYAFINFKAERDNECRIFLLQFFLEHVVADNRTK